MIFTLVAVVIYFAFGLDIRLYYKDRFKRPVDPSTWLHVVLIAMDIFKINTLTIWICLASTCNEHSMNSTNLLQFFKFYSKYIRCPCGKGSFGPGNTHKTQAFYPLKRRRPMGVGIPITNLIRSDDRLRLIMGPPIPIRRCLFREYRPWCLSEGSTFCDVASDVSCPCRLGAIMIWCITMTSHECHGVSNRRQFDWLFNILFRVTTKTASRHRIIGPLWAEYIVIQ